MSTAAHPRYRLDPGRPYPLGAHFDGSGVNFAVFSAHASKIELCLFDVHGRRERQRIALPECTDEIWHGYLPEAQPGLVYGYRAHGPYDPTRGHRFNPHKLLIDPYARQLLGEVQWNDAVFGYKVRHSKADLSMDRRDSAAWVPKCVVAGELFDWGRRGRPDTTWAETVIYEAHVKGVSMLRDDMPESLRGTCSALTQARFLEHLHRLGVTTIELLPVHAFLQDHFLVERGLHNYWGYNTLAFFAPEAGYLAGGDPNDLRRTIRELQAHGFEVILDVVYNHTAEGNELGPTLSWRGLDNASYYRLVPGEERHYINDTGCGNTVNLSHPRVLQMVLDSLRYWAESYRIDGFRFDLGVTLGREGTGYDPGSGFFDALLQDPLLSRLKLISEPWDIGPDGYQLGNHPPGFAEWNDRFRDAVRRFWKGDAGMRPELAARMAGSADLFDRRFRRPWASINYLASHDGFTAYDVVCHETKHNEANGDSNADGHAENHSRNWGAEGPSRDRAVNLTRERVLRSMLASVFMANGTPMLLAGDELGNSQRGNNNAYCQDNEISWLDWRQLDMPTGRDLSRFIGRLTQLRRAHPSLRMDRYLDREEELAPGIRRLQWYDLDGAVMNDAAWGFSEGRVLGLRRACARAQGGVELSLVLVNASDGDVEFRLPEPVSGWWRVLDTAGVRLAETPVQGPQVLVCAHALMLLIARIDEAQV